jgi:hypothetical protein
MLFSSPAIIGSAPLGSVPNFQSYRFPYSIPFVFVARFDRTAAHCGKGRFMNAGGRGEESNNQ